MIKISNENFFIEVDKMLLNQKEAASFIGVSVNTFKQKFRHKLKKRNGFYNVVDILKLFIDENSKEDEVIVKDILKSL